MRYAKDEAVRAAINYGASVLGMLDTEMAAELCLTRERVRQLRSVPKAKRRPREPEPSRLKPCPAGCGRQCKATSEVCSRCWTKTPEGRARLAEKHRRWARTNPVKVKEQHRRYVEENREKVRGWARRYYHQKKSRGEEAKMHDDREEFEKDQVHQDREGDEVYQQTGLSGGGYPREDEWEARDREARFERQREAHRNETPAERAARVERENEGARGETEEQRRARLTAAMERLAAEVAEHEVEGAWAGYRGNRPAEPSPHPDALVQRLRTAKARVEEAMQPGWTGADQEPALDATETPAEPAAGPRFGERLRAYMRHTRTDEIATAIDHDAEALRGEVAGKQRALELVRTDLRREVEQAVERLRYTWGGAFETDRKDVLDAEPFLAELDRIFGGRREATPWPLVDILERLCTAADHLLGDHNCDCHGYEELKAARDAARQWGAHP